MSDQGICPVCGEGLSYCLDDVQDMCILKEAYCDCGWEGAETYELVFVEQEGSVPKEK